MARSSGDQINQLTSYLDASNVYGSTKEDQDALRLGRKGKLKYTNLHIRKPLLPALDPNTAEEECRISTRNLHCFAAGDRRCNEQPGLTAIHTVFLREHNRSVHCLNFFWCLSLIGLLICLENKLITQIKELGPSRNIATFKDTTTPVSWVVLGMQDPGYRYR